MKNRIAWLGHDTFRISGPRTVYTDPFRIKKPDRADIILITHEHYDHCSPADVAKLQVPDTIIVTTADCAPKLTGDVRTMQPGDKLEAAGVTIEAVPSYNISKQFHPREKGWVGFIITLAGERIYLAGDTDHIPEMKNFRVDIALLPVSGTYVMTAEEAASAALDMSPGLAIPMHYGSIVGTADDALKFGALLQGKIPVELLPEE